MDKFGRNYILTVTGGNIIGALIITLPFTIEFDITRNTLTSANVCQIRIYNLSLTNRNALRKNVTSYALPLLNIVLQAGYGVNLPIIFTGNVSQGWSVREGINFITQLECFDGGFSFINSNTNVTIPAGTPYQFVIASLIQSMAPNVIPGAIGNYPGVAPKQITYSGNTIDILNQLTGGGFFIDNGKGNALGDNEYSLSRPPSLINASTGLLNTPILEQNIVRFDMMFEPSLTIGTGISLFSSTEATFNGFYKITSVKHRGMISQTVCGEVITTGEFFSLQTQTPVAPSGT
jgi:hypothetical protein